MSNQTIQISSGLLDRIVADCESRYPNEACGLLIGDGSRVRDIVICDNTWPAGEDRDHRFTIDPLVILKAEQSASASGQTILGTYHSHPDHPAKPSEFDLEVAWPVYVYLILEIRQGKLADRCGWVINEKLKQFEEVNVEILY